MDDTTRTLSTWDRSALWGTILIGIVAAGWTFATAVWRIIEIAPNREVPVVVHFADTEAALPVGPDGTLITVLADQVTVRVSDINALSHALLMVGTAIGAITVITVIGCTVLLCRELIAGRAFSPRAVGAVGVGVLGGLIGGVVAWFFSNMGVNGALAALGAFEASTTAPIEPTLIFAIAALGSVTAAFTIGGRIQRETEGLV